MTETETQPADDEEATQDEPHVEAPDEEAQESEEPEAEEADHPEPPAEAPQQVTPEAWEKRFQKAEKRFDTYARAVTSIWEDDAIHLTPFNLDPSAPPGFIDTRNAGLIEEGTKQAALAFLGFAREQEYEADPETRECATCKGKGKTKTGSHVAGKETRACPTCRGSGATGLALTDMERMSNGHKDEPWTLAEASSADAPERDNWGEPRILPDGRENPNYGRQPQYKVTVEPFGITAGLGVQDAPAGA